MKRVKPFHLDRRHFLLSAGAWGLVAPILRVSRAEAATAPRRLILFGTPNGINRLSTHGMSPEMQKMAGDILLIDGISMKAADDPTIPGIDDHIKGPPVMFTAHIKGKDLANGKSSGKPLGPSLDQFAVSKLDPPTRLPSIELGVGASSSVNYGLNLGALPAENSPANALSRILGGVMAGSGGTTSMPVATPTGPSEADVLRMRRKSVLDHVNAELVSLKPKLAPSERAKLDGHLESLRALEKRLVPTTTPGTPGTPTTSPPVERGPACKPSSVSAGVSGFPEVGRAQMDILAMAFACDASRIATLRWGGRTHNLTHKWAGVSRGHHDIVHSDDVAGQAKVTHWYGDQFAYLLGKLKSMTDIGGGSVLDNTVVVWNADMANGGHGWTNGVMVVAGGKNLGVKVGRVARYNNASQNDLFLAVLRAIGVNAENFGNPAFSSGPLSGVL
jgi:hypothetical protein